MPDGKYRTKACPMFIVVIESDRGLPDSMRSFYDHADVTAEMRGYVEAAVHDKEIRAHIFERVNIVERPCNTVWRDG